MDCDSWQGMDCDSWQGLACDSWQGTCFWQLVKVLIVTCDRKLVGDGFNEIEIGTIQAPKTWWHNMTGCKRHMMTRISTIHASLHGFMEILATRTNPRVS